MLIDTLEQIGLTRNEAVVYTKLASLGKARAGEIINSTGLHRNIVYTVLEELERRKLVAKMSTGKVFVFVANSLKTLVEELESKKEKISQATEEIKKIASQETNNVAIYEGVSGIVYSRERSLSLPPGETLYVLGGSGLSSTPEFNKYWDRFHKRRIKNKVEAKILFDRTVPSEYVAARNHLPLTAAKYLPLSVDLPAMFDMFGDTMTIAIPGNDPIAFSVRSPEASDAMKKYFEYLWNQEVMVETGLLALEHAFYNMLAELKPGEEYYVIGAATNIYNDESKNRAVNDFYNTYHSKRIKKEVVVKMLAYREYLERGRKRFMDCGDPDGKVSFIKPFISMPRIPMQINLYNNKAYIIFYGENPTVLSFSKPEMYEGFKAYFDSQWNQDTYTLRGPEALRDIWIEGNLTGGVKFIGARGYFMDRFPKFFAEVISAMPRQGVIWQNVCDPGMRGHRITTFPWSKTKYTLSNSRNFNVVWLYNKKVAIVNWAEDEPIILVSANQHLVQSYNDYFEELWRRNERPH